MALRTPIKAIAAFLSVILMSVTFASAASAQARPSLLEKLREARENAALERATLGQSSRFSSNYDPRKVLLYVYLYRQWQSNRSASE